ncbi:MAG: DUF3526 domain-containing protein [Gammaproteobacteria bacterium]|nr:DUF3526 domain-containing protein [Gammaproteobacteria bacterium]
MFRMMMGHEIRLLASSSALGWLLAGIAAAVLFAAWSGGQTLQQQTQAAQVARDIEAGKKAKLREGVVAYEQYVEENGLEFQTYKAMHRAPRPGESPEGTSAGMVGTDRVKEYAVLPPSGLAAFAVGQSDLLTNHIAVTMRNLAHVTEKSEFQNPLHLLSGSFDLAFVVIYLLPIFVLGLSYNMLSSEKEQGTLAMILAHPVSLRELMASKLVSRIGILVGVVLAAGLVSLLLVGNQLGSAETWLRFLAWAALTALYCLFWFALALLVNARGRSSENNGITLAGLWLLLVVVVPTLVSLIASIIYPPPSRMEMIAAGRAASQEAEANAAKSLDEFYFDHLEFVPNPEDKIQDFFAHFLAREQAVSDAVAPVQQRFREQLNQQQQLVNRFQFVSPAIMMRLALNEVSGTSVDRYEHFEDQVLAFRDRWTEYFMTRFLQNVPLRSADYEKFPAFDYQPEPLALSLARIAASAIGLAVLSMLLLLAGANSLRRFVVAASTG